MSALGERFRTAQDINDLGQIVGSAYTDDQVYTAYLWDNGIVTDLGPGEAVALNNAGEVIGKLYSQDPFSDDIPLLWKDGVQYNLNDLIPVEAGWEIMYASDINNLGQIVGYGQINGQEHAFLMTPVPEPATLCLLALGGLILTRRKNKASI